MATYLDEDILSTYAMSDEDDDLPEDDGADNDDMTDDDADEGDTAE